jgi:hypothetical protein
MYVYHVVSLSLYIYIYMSCMVVCIWLQQPELTQFAHMHIFHGTLHGQSQGITKVIHVRIHRHDCMCLRDLVRMHLS